MPYALLALIMFALWNSNCSELRCPPDYVKREGRCKHCPEGSEARDDECIGLEGGVTFSPAHAEEDAESSDTGRPREAGLVDNGGEGAGHGDGDASDSPSDGRSPSGTGGNTSLEDAGDTSSAQPIDPCRGNPQCVACGNDSQCPDPGACLTRRCNTSKGICEPTFASAEVVCGASSKCDGNGKCVGCLSDNDCGAPGECKVRYCNEATHVCEPRNVPSGQECAAGYCNGAGICVGCTDKSQCAPQICRVAACTAGKCTYSPLVAGSPGTCSLGQVCNGVDRCVDCTMASHCAGKVTLGVCSTEACVANRCATQGKIGRCGYQMICTGETCGMSCGNFAINSEADEQCEIGVDGATDWTCEKCRLTGYTVDGLARSCTIPGDCQSGLTCDTSHFGFGTCMPSCVTAATSCPLPSGWVATACLPPSANDKVCVVACRNGTCPGGATCTSNVCLRQ